jgi:hypothetical protein
MSAAPFGYEDDNETPAKAAIAVADAHTGKVGLPTYSELVEALRRAINETPRRYGDRRTPHGDRVAEQPAWCADANALLSRIPS